SYPKSVANDNGESWSRMAFIGGKFLWWGLRSQNLFNPPRTDNPIPTMSTSADGLSWKQARDVSGAQDPFAPHGAVESAAYGNGTYVAVGWQGIAAQSEPIQATIWSSTNGYNWTRSYRSLKPYLQSVAFGDGMFVAVGHSGTIVHSVNGLNWTEIQ